MMDDAATRRWFFGAVAVGAGCIPVAAAALDVGVMANLKVPPFTEAPSTVVGGTLTSVFPFEFPFWAAADILVFIDGELVDAARYSVEGFAIQGNPPLAVEGGYGSGAVTLDTAVNNCTVTIDRRVVGDRQTQFSRSVPLGMPALNGDLNRLTARQQDLARQKVNRPSGDRAGLFLSFDANGNEVTSSGTGADGGLRTDLADDGGSTLVGFEPAGLGARVRTMQDKLRDLVSVKDFDVVGDGSDETTGIQAAIDVVEASGGGLLHFPACADSYGFTNLTIGGRVVLVGQGFTEWAGAPPSGYLKRVGGTGPGVLVTGDGAGFQNLHIDGDDVAGDLVQVLGGRFALRDTSLVQAGRDNLRIGTDLLDHELNMNLWRISNLISLEAGRYGFYVHDGKALPDVNAGLLHGIDVRGCVNDGIYMKRAWDCDLYGVVCQNNGGTGLRLGGLSRSIYVPAPYLEANGNNELVLDAGAQTNVVMGNRSGIASTGYVNNSGNLTNTLFLYQPSLDGMHWNDNISVMNKSAGGQPKVTLVAGVDEIMAGILVGREGAGAGTDGEVAIQVKRAGNTPIDRLLVTDGTAGPAANTALVVPTSTTPASAAAAGVTGTIAWDASYLYVCTATNTWKRVAIATW